MIWKGIEVGVSVFGDSDGIYNSFGVRNVCNFEGNGAVGSVMIGAVFVTGSFVGRLSPESVTGF